MGEQRSVGITFHLDGQRYAYRGWHHVPRVGEEVVLRYEDGWHAFTVCRVQWSTEGEGAFERQLAHIVIEHSEDPDHDHQD